MSDQVTINITEVTNPVTINVTEIPQSVSINIRETGSPPTYNDLVSADIEDEVILTKAEYLALDPKVPNVKYIIIG